MAKNVLFIAVVTERETFRGGKWYGGQTHSEIYGADLNDLLQSLHDDEYGNRLHALICVDLDTGSAEALDAHRELDAWQDAHMSVAEERALAPAAWGR